MCLRLKNFIPLSLSFLCRFIPSFIFLLSDFGICCVVPPRFPTAPPLFLLYGFPVSVHVAISLPQGAGARVLSLDPLVHNLATLRERARAHRGI